MSDKKTFGSLYKGRVVLRNGKEIEVWKVQSKNKAKVCDKTGVAAQSDTLRDIKESKDREGTV